MRGGHRHVHLMSGQAKAAAEYTHEFCQAINSGIAVYVEYLAEANSRGTFAVEEVELFYIGPDMCDEADVIPFVFKEWGYCIDDSSGHQLPMNLVR